MTRMSQGEGKTFYVSCCDHLLGLRLLALSKLSWTWTTRPKHIRIELLFYIPSPESPKSRSRLLIGALDGLLHIFSVVHYSDTGSSRQVE